MTTLSLPHPPHPGPLPRGERGRYLWRALPCWTLCAAFALCQNTLARDSDKEAQLPKIGPAPDFTLTSQDGKRVSLRDLRGRVTVVTFIFTTCSDTCPILTAKLVGIQRKLAPKQPKVTFAAITVDPLNDTPAVLKKYGEAHSADPAYFVFLTGPYQEIEDVTRRYAIYWKKSAASGVEHTFLTSIIDAGGTLRVQYLGSRFDPNEFMSDVQSLLAEGTAK